MEGNRASIMTCLTFSVRICCYCGHAVVQQTPKYKRESRAKLIVCQVSTLQLRFISVLDKH